MPQNELKNWGDIYGTDLKSLSKKELEDHINQLKQFRLRKMGHMTYTSIDLNISLSLASSELSSRNAEMLAKVAIGISVASMIISAVGIWGGF